MPENDNELEHFRKVPRISRNAIHKDEKGVRVIKEYVEKIGGSNQPISVTPTD